MISVDTNILVRILADDPGNTEQTAQARRLAAAHQRLHVPLVVLVETFWVLKRAYGVAKTELSNVLEHLAQNRAYELDEAEMVRQAIADYRRSSADFPDVLVLAASRRRGLTLATFDRKLLALANTAAVT